MHRSVSDTIQDAKEWQEADSLLPETPSAHATSRFSIEQQGTSQLPIVHQAPEDARKARLALYVSHCLSAWGQRAWEFTVGLVMLQISGSTSLFLVALFGLVDAAALVVLGPIVGSYLDKTPRLQGACIMYAIQNSMVALSAAASLILLMRNRESTHDTTTILLIILAIAAGSMSTVGASGASMSVEREWTKTLSNGDGHLLAIVNAGMKRIDLCCLILSPIAVGLLIQYGSIEAAVFCIMLYNVAVWLPECSLLSRAQASSPALLVEKPTSIASHNNDIDDDNYPHQAGGTGKTTTILYQIQHYIERFTTYARQPSASAAISLALLYMTVMSFGTLMTAYLKWRGLDEVSLSIYRAFGAASGILATLVFPILEQRIGLISTGALSIVLQLVCVLLATLPSIFLGETSNKAATLFLVWGLVLSRFGLWSFDLAANQIIQEYTDPLVLGTTTGCQSSLQSLFQMLAYTAGLVVYRPQHFVWLMVGSSAAVGAAACIFILVFAASTSSNYLGFLSTSLSRDGRDGDSQWLRRESTPISP